MTDVCPPTVFAIIEENLEDFVHFCTSNGLTVRDLLNTVSIESNTVEYASQNLRVSNAAVVAEGGAKPETDLAWELKTETTTVIAHWIKASRQIIDDSSQLRDMIDSELRYGLALEEEAQILFGDGTGVNLTGLATQASAFSAEFTPSDQTEIDIIGLAVLQSALADYVPDGILVHPSDWMRMRLTKGTDSEYLLGSPQSDVSPILFGLPVIASKAIPKDKYLVGSFSEVGTLYDRWAPRIEVGYSSDDFIKNLVTVLAEERIALAVKQPGALIYGDFGNIA